MGTRTLRSHTRKDDAELQTRMDHQKLLHERNNSECIRTYANEGSMLKDKAVSRLIPESYSKTAQLPNDTKPDFISLDRKRQVVLLPIYGLVWPVHVSFIKSVSKSEEGHFSFIRLNLTGPQKNQKNEPEEEDGGHQPGDHFIRSVTFKSADLGHAAEVYKGISELKKLHQLQTQERNETDEVVELEPLIVLESRVPRLNEVFIRPSLESKRQVGILEIHSNGLRYKPMLKSTQTVDIPFSNIKHFFFQPCDGEMLVLLHIYLKSPIVIAKKKTFDIQIYREASESLVDDTSGRKRKVRYGDEDEIAQEREDRKRRAELNEEFKKFADQIHVASGDLIDVDSPYRELGFDGVPHRQNVFLQPTTDCLVHLSEPPFFIITLSEVEVTFLERVVFGLKNFDLVFVFKDHKREPAHVNSIPVSKLEFVKEWLDSVDIPFCESKVNFNWTNILKTVDSDPVKFYEMGGWTFLEPDNNNDDSFSEGESEFDPDEEESEFEEESESEFSEEDEEESGESYEEEDESAPDWDELEREAEEEDRKKERRLK